MANSDQCRRVLEAYEKHLITENEALEMVDEESVSKLTSALKSKKASSRLYAEDGAKAGQAQRFS